MNKTKLTLYMVKALLISLFTTIFILGIDSIIRVSKHCSKSCLSVLGLDPDREKMGSDPDIPNRDKNCVNKSEVRPRYS